MATFLELAKLSDAVYGGDARPPAGWSEKLGALGSYGFSAAAYTGPGEIVVAFRGTTARAGDIAADAMLGVGMNNSHFSQAEAFVASLGDVGKLALTGHSLGGAIAQVVGNRRRLPFATFNAPGVAVLASRNIGFANSAALALRVGGMVASSVLSPMQAARDIRSAFYQVEGVNIRLVADLVSSVGVHYGTLITILGNGVSPVSQHRITTMIEVLKTNSLGRLGIADRA